MKLRLRGMLLFCLLLNLSQQAAAQVESFHVWYRVEELRELEVECHQLR